MKKQKIQKLFILFSIFGLALGGVASADNVSVSNNISVSASSGGNIGGTVHQGSASVSAHIEQTLNGVAEPPIDLATTSASGTLHVEIRSEKNSTSVHVDRNASGDAKPVDFIPARNFDRPSITTAILPPSPVAIVETGSPPGVALLMKLGDFFGHIFNWIFEHK